MNCSNDVGLSNYHVIGEDENLTSKSGPRRGESCDKLRATPLAEEVMEYSTVVSKPGLGAGSVGGAGQMEHSYLNHHSAEAPVESYATVSW